MSLRSVIPNYPNPPPNNNQLVSNYPQQVPYRPPCPQYRGMAAGGIVFTAGSVYGTCSPNAGGPFAPPYDFVCDKFGRNCKSPSNPSGQTYRDIDTFCCYAGNESNTVQNNIIVNPVYPVYPVNPVNPSLSRCCNNDLNSCAKCLTYMGVTTSQNPTVNHFNNMQRCKRMCSQHRNNNLLL
jgi:hypothetical protein